MREMSYGRWSFAGHVVMAAVLLGACEAERAEEEGMEGEAMAAVPELVEPGVISTDANETFPAIDPGDGSLWFSTYEDGFDEQTIMVARRTETGWREPEVAPFSGTHGDRAPRFTPDGDRIYFTSNRPTVAGGEAGDMNIWVVERRADGGWVEPQLVPRPVSSPDGRDIHASIVADGTIYVASNRPGGAGRSDIYRIPSSDGRFGAAAALGPVINDSLSQPDVFVSADESWMILVITEAPDGLGGDDLYLVRAVDGEWSRPQNLGAPINSPEYEYGPTLSPDGEYLYYTSHRNGSADIFASLRAPSAASAGGPGGGGALTPPGLKVRRGCPGGRPPRRICRRRRATGEWRGSRVPAREHAFSGMSAGALPASPLA